MSLENKKGIGLSAGRKPIEQKPTIDMDAWSPLGKNALSLPPRLLKLGEEEGIEFRWLRYSHIEANSGQHDKGWQVYKIGNPDDLGLTDFHVGKNPDGTLRRGRMVLGYKPKQAAQYHRQVLKDRADRQWTSPASKENVKHKAREAGSKVYEGYDDPEGFRTKVISSK